MKKLGLLVAPVLFALGCGGLDDVLGPGDGGSLICQGKTVFPLHTGNYTMSNVSQVVTDCVNVNGPAAQTALTGSIKILDNPGTGTICFLNNTTPQTKWACFTAMCNTISPVSTPLSIDDGMCVFTQDVSITGQITGTSKLDISVVAARSGHQSTTAGSCKQINNCSVKYSATLTGPP